MEKKASMVFTTALSIIMMGTKTKKTKKKDLDSIPPHPAVAADKQVNTNQILLLDSVDGYYNRLVPSLEAAFH